MSMIWDDVTNSYIEDGTSGFDPYAGDWDSPNSPVNEQATQNLLNSTWFQSLKPEEIKTPGEANALIRAIESAFGKGAAAAVKGAIFNKDGETLNLATLATGAAGIYGLLGGNQVQTGGYNKPIPKLTATREQIPYAADPNRRPGESGRSYFTDTQYTAPADAAATQAAAKTQAQGIASLATPRPKAVNPYEGKYKPAWNPPEQTEKTTAIANPASGVAQLLPVPQAQGFQRTPPEGMAQTQGGATSAAPAAKVDLDAMRQEQKRYAAENVSENSENTLREVSKSPMGYQADPFMPVMGGEPPPPSQEEMDSLQAQIRQKQAANSGLASLPSSDFAYSTNPQEAATQKAMQDMQREQSSKTTSNPSDTGGAGYVENPAYLAADPNRMTMDYIPRYVKENVAATSNMDSLQALIREKQAAQQDWDAVPAHIRHPEPIEINEAPQVKPQLEPERPIRRGEDHFNTELFDSPANSAPFGSAQGVVAEAPQVLPGPTFAAGGLAAGGFVVPADVVAHLGNGSSSSGLALLAKKLNAKPIKGDGDGMSDSIPTHIDGKEKALVANDEAYISPEMVARIGGGDGKVGSEKLYAMMEKIRKARTGNPEQGKRINPEKFMPGGIAQLAGGGTIHRFNLGGTAPTTTTPPLSTSTATPLGTSTSSSLSPWAGDYVTNYLGKGQALAEAPYQAYQGPLTAGASDLQNQAFAGIGAAAQAGYTPTTYQGGTFGAEQAQQYMNPYLSAALNPQLDEMRRQAGITRTADAGRMTQAGAFGGSRQAIMESEGNRNLLEKQGQAIGTGYQTAYDKAMQQFNTEQDRRMGAEKATEASRQYSADYGLKSLGEAASLGAVQRGIEGEGITADRQQFEEQRDYPLKMVQYQKDLLQGLPITSAATTANTTGVSNLSSQILGLQGLYNQLAGLGQAPAASTTVR